MSDGRTYKELTPHTADSWETELDGYIFNIQSAMREGTSVTRYVDDLVSELRSATSRGLVIQTEVSLGKWGFHQWLRDQSNRDDRVGDLARDYVQALDDGQAKVQTPEQLQSRLQDAGADFATLDALTEASDEYNNI